MDSDMEERFNETIKQRDLLRKDIEKLVKQIQRLNREQEELKLDIEMARQAYKSLKEGLK